MKYRHRAIGRPTNVCCAILGYDQGLYVWFRDQGAGSAIDREMAYVLIVKGYCHGSRKDRENKYTASYGLGMFVESPETDPSRNTLERGGSKGNRFKVAISLLGALGTYIHGKQRKLSNLTNIRTRLYHTVTLGNLFASSV